MLNMEQPRLRLADTIKPGEKTQVAETKVVFGNGLALITWGLFHLCNFQGFKPRMWSQDL